MGNAGYARRQIVNKDQLLVGLCLVLLVLGYLSAANFVARRSDAIQNNERIKSDITVLLQGNRAISSAISSLRQLDHDIGKLRILDAKVRSGLQDRVEQIETRLLQEQKLISYISQRVNAFQPALAEREFGLVDSAYAGPAAAAPGASHGDPALRQMVVAAAFLALLVIGAIAAWAAFTATDEQRAAFARDVLKTEIGFLTGLVTAIFTQ